MTPPRVRIVALPDGPLAVEGACDVTDRDGNPFAPRASKKPGIFLCRCGASAEKPWCDGSHKRVGFRDQRASSAPVIDLSCAPPAPSPASAPGSAPPPSGDLPPMPAGSGSAGV